MNHFFIHEPISIAGWKKIHSIGVLYGGVLTYYDFYQNANGARLFIQQDGNLNSFFRKALLQKKGNSRYTFSFFRKATMVQGYGNSINDLAAYTDMQQGRSNFDIIHKEANGTFTDILIYGYRVSQSEIEEIGLDYLHAPTK